ncbi:RBPJ-interacting and tubulin-associated protein 1 [Colius striatus]|uniref:RBPJ-interacting and tubulin-associated protein 1 n=1 Tax=Colius striatus TaxID=57412 RepID=UPI002B1E5E1F|nr:RBPJ-interacting and tubulin-associated protein 1 [Colius striatus]
MRAAAPGPSTAAAPRRDPGPAAAAPTASRGARGRARGGRRARPSFVDESLFGSPAGARPAPAAFPPPWAPAAAPLDPRPRSGCRPRAHTPSFCDETLFGAKPEGPARAAPRVRNEDVAKLHALLWSPPPAPRPGLTPRSRDTPLRAVSSAAPGPEGNPRVSERPESDSCSGGRGAPGRGRSQSLLRLNTPSGRLHRALDNPKRGRSEKQSPVTAPTTPRGPLVRGRSKSVCRPLSGSPVAAGGCTPRPPWK